MTEIRGHILYDGDCGICKQIAGKLSTTFNKRGFELAPLQEDWVAEKIDVGEEDLLKDMRLLFTDGTLHSGANAYRYLMRRIWWAYPIYLLSIIPGLSHLFDWSYRKFADNRHRISTTCKISPQPKKSVDD